MSLKASGEQLRKAYMLCLMSPTKNRLSLPSSAIMLSCKGLMS